MQSWLEKLNDVGYSRGRTCRVHLRGICHRGTVTDATTEQMLYIARAGSTLPTIVGILIASIDRIEWES